MGHRSIVLLLGACWMLLASQSFALGLGKIRLESALNEPLSAEIELFEVRELSKEEIRVSIASREDFERIGVDKTYFLSDFQFDVVLSGPRSPYIKVSSRKVVREPFINFVLQVQWPSGKLLREYTLLLDLPTYSDSAPAPVQAAPSAPQQQSVTPTPPRQQTTTSPSYNPRSSFEGAPGRPSTAPSGPRYTGDSYEVRANDTLWEIAASVRPDGGVSVHQAMMAIQRENPDAFINNNVNLLKRGQILRIPTRDQMSSIGRRQAVQDFADQTARWRGGEADPAPAQLSGGRSFEGDSPGTSSREGRVKISSPDDTFGSAEGRTGGDSAQVSTEALENELSVTLEQLDKSSKENTELRNKVSSLEEQIETMERMLEVSNESLRSLEASVQKTEEAAAEASETLAEVDTSIEEVGETTTELGAEIASQLEGELESETGSESIDSLYGEGDSTIDETESGLAEIDPSPAVEATAEPEATATPAVDPTRVAAPLPVQEKGFLDLILDNILYIALGVVAIAAGAFFFLKNRGDDEDEDFEEMIRQHDDDVDLGVEDELGPEEDLDLSQFEEEESDTTVIKDYGEAAAAPEEAEPETEDVVAEADIYIAYGKYDQAEEMLTKALEKDPMDENVRLKLLEVYASQGDIERFDPHYAKLRAFASPNVLERADTLRGNISGAAEFDESGFDVSDVAAAGAAIGAAAGTAALADSFDLADDDDQTVPMNDGTDSADDALDFELDLPESDDSQSDDSFDLDLDLSDEEDSGDNDFSGFELDDVDTQEDEQGEVDFDLGDIELSTDENSTTQESLAADLEELGSEIDLAIDLDTDDTAVRDRGDADADDELPSLDLDSNELGAGDTMVNEALNDEYIEQQMSGDELDLDESLEIEESGPDLGQTQALDALDLDGDSDLDLSSLDAELDALTSEVDNLGADLEEPQTDFDDLDSDLELSADGTSASLEEPDTPLEDSDDSMLDQALSEIPEASPESEFELPEVSADDDSNTDDDLEFLSDSDEIATKLDLARAYIDMGDQEGARDIIREIVSEGSPEQKAEAEGLLTKLDA